MADEVKDEIVVDAGSDADEEAKDTQPSKNGKAFSQTDVDRIVARERAAFRKKQEAAEADLASRDETLAKYEGIIQKQIEAQIADLPEFEQRIFKKLPLLEQLDMLAENEIKVSKKGIPPTPKSKRTEDDFKPAHVDKVI